jgi:hypothetical protein
MALFLGALFVERLSLQGFFDPDGFHQMALFREILRTGSIPLRDTFAFTPTVFPVVHHEWGAGAILYGLVTTFGAKGIVIARWTLSVAVALVTFRLARRRAPFSVIAYCAPIAVILGQVAFTTIRAGLYSMLLLAIVLSLIERDRRDPSARRFLGVYLPLLLLWTNLHAGWVVGVAAVASHALEQLVRRRRFGHLLAALAATPLTMLATPYGRHYPAGWWRGITHRRDLIGEWAPLFHSPYVVGLTAFGLSALLLLYTLARSGARALPGLPFVLLTAAAAVRHERHVTLYALAWFCAVPGYLAATPLGELVERLIRRRRVAGSIMVIALAASIGLTAVAASRAPLSLAIPAQLSDVGKAAVVYPTGAIEHLLHAHFRGRVEVGFVVGAFVTWKLYPDVLVSLDGRYEAAYPDNALEDCATLFGASAGWQEVLARHAPDAIVAMRTEGLASALPGGTRFARVYQDDVFEIWALPASRLPVVSRIGQPNPTSLP